MEPLSPRSTNIQFKAKGPKSKEMVDEEAKKAEAAKKALKEKEYAPAPPEWVIQPPIARGGLAEKFRTGRCLGKGGFAICYEGELRNKRNGSDKTIFALKIVRAKMSQRKMEDKFRTELQIHAKMRHPNIVEFHRAFTFKDSTYVVLELCSNGSIMDMVKKRRCLSLPEVRRLTIQLCGAIKYMHTRNVIHRDLKMGNLFLDKDMNLKIGDFGLAAVLVSKDEYQGIYDNAKMRRTTLCGTPNYIAPEILEKDRGGHDHKVDIWAIGVIVFAMLAGQPPFQSSSQNEIYRRAKSVEYSWPAESKYSNDIPPEAKDLVARLLKVDAEERPDPDQVIGHPFFSMHGGNAIPLIMEEHFRFQIPQFLDAKARPRGDVMLNGTERISLKRLAKHCGVGFLPGDKAPYAVVGADVELPLYKECFAEEASGTSPIVPLPKDMVYKSKFPSASWLALPADDSVAPVASKADVDIQHAASSQPLTKRETQGSAPEQPRRAPVQSHAATLRAAHFGPKGLQSDCISNNLGVNNIASDSRTNGASTRERRGLLNQLPVRPTTNLAGAASLESKENARKPWAVRSNKVIVLDDVPERELPDKRKLPRPLTRDEVIDKACTDPDGKRRDLAARSRARIASNVQNEMAEVVDKGRKTSSESGTIRSRDTSDSLTPSSALIGPDEVPECLPNTRPNNVLLQLQKLRKELEVSIDKMAKQRDRSQAQEIDLKNKTLKYRPVVVKWVDYTNKFGIGYILANGTVGCVFNGIQTSSPTCVVVADAERHLKRRKMSSYLEKHQIVPKRGSPIEFIENCGEDGLKRVFVQASQYQVKISAAGVPERISPGMDIYDFEKRKKLCLWDKFGKYMTQSLGKSDEVDLSTPQEEVNSSRSRRNNAAGPFVKFYQRLGNVGIWGFDDGSFQFNFPDHTKLVISEGGSWLDFYHLPIAAAQTLKAGEVLEAGALAERSVLCYPTCVMLSGIYHSHDFQELIRENELHAKISFIGDIVGIWLKEKGLGCMGRKKGLKWEGMMEKGGKLVWVTVGAKGEDKRYEMPAAKN